jgi:hypothetical protein
MKLKMGNKYTLSRQFRRDFGTKEIICKIINIQIYTITVQIGEIPYTINKEYALDNLKEYRVLRKMEVAEEMEPILIPTVIVDDLDSLRILNPDQVDIKTGDIEGILDEQTKLDNNIIDVPDDVKEKIEEIKEEENAAKYESGYGIDPKNPDLGFI